MTLIGARRSQKSAVVTCYVADVSRNVLDDGDFGRFASSPVFAEDGVRFASSDGPVLRLDPVCRASAERAFCSSVGGEACPAGEIRAESLIVRAGVASCLACCAAPLGYILLLIFPGEGHLVELGRCHAFSPLGVGAEEIFGLLVPL